MNQETPLNQKRNLISYFILIFLLTAFGSFYFFKNKDRKAGPLDEGVSRTEENNVSSTAPAQESEEPLGVTQVPDGSGQRFFLTIDLPAESATVNSGRIVVKGRTVAGAEVWINDTQAVVDAKGNYSAAVTLEEGENYILVSGGNEYGDSEVERTVYFEK